MSKTDESTDLATTLLDSSQEEQTLIGFLIRRPEEIDILAGDLCGEFFTSLRFRVIFETLRGMREAKWPIRVNAFAEQLNSHGYLDKVGGLSVLAQMAQSGLTLNDPLSLIETIRAKKLRRCLVEIAENLIHDAKNPDADPREALDLAEHRLVKAIDRLPEAVSLTTRNELDSVASRLRREAAEPSRGSEGMRTGFSAVDALLGGLRPGEVTVLAGGSGTHTDRLLLAWTLTMAVADKQPVLILAPGRCEKSLMEELLACQAGLNLKEMRLQMGNQHLPPLEEAINALEQAKIYALTGGWRDSTELRAATRRARARNDFSAIIVTDAVGLLDSMGGYRFGTIEECARLSELACAFDVPVIVAAELESASASPPSLADLQKPAGLVEVAGTILLLSSEDARHEGEAGYQPTCIKEVFIVRSSRGAKGRVSLKYGANGWFVPTA